ncbi:AAA domain-containing protein [Bradyrhizobium zhanjiangense]|uniref:AAA domain-containing protein n=1 Tax=Bradyrhizobium zhanjiangense TaxID=1325107 RepID=UPI001008BB3C|nr:AAA domain-containing protein [Bradyrhizobium zhanjiangense]
MPSTLKKLRPLADQFDLGDQYLSAPGAEPLKSAIISAHDKREDQPVVLKYWQKTGSAVDDDLREIWQHEMRQAERVLAYPGADKVIVELLRYGEASDAFFLAMPRDLTPLDNMIRHARSDHWLNNLDVPRSRIVLWRNAERLAKALEAVHNQGLVYGRLDSSSVFTASATAPDFRLGSFEWCVRLSEADKAPVVVFAKSADAPIIMSFLDDWRALGLLLASLLKLDVSRLSRGLSATEEIDAAGERLAVLEAGERDMLRWLIEPARHRAVDAEIVCRRIERVILDLSASALEDRGRYLLAIRTGSTLLTRALRDASGDLFDADDHSAQVNFVDADIAGGAELVRTADGSLIVMTELFGYSLAGYSPDGFAEADWRVAICDHARPRKDIFLGRHRTVELPAHRIEVIRYGSAGRRLQEIRRDAIDWRTALDDLGDHDDEALEAVQHGLLLAQLTEALFRAAEIIPVRARKRRLPGGEERILLSPRSDDRRGALVEALGVDSPERTLSRMFLEEEADIDAKWLLSDSGSLSDLGRASVAVRFIQPVRLDNERVYAFSATGELPPTADLFLRQVDDAGTEGAINRRLRLLGALATQEELLSMLAAPRKRLRRYHDELLEDEDFRDLDASKQQALRSIWTTGPTQLVVGPPGVGKTKLVTEIVRRVLQQQPAARILLSAQAHQALDQLAAGVQKTLAKAAIDPEPLLVRSRADNAAELSGAQTTDRVKQYLNALDGSPLVRGAPIEVATAIRAMKDDARQGRNASDHESRRQRRSFESLVLRSANILFSTANSGDLARLVNDHNQFDWVIVEEAAKATGPELIAPLLLSMRRLLIGDHNQLPPFDTDRVLEFLANQTNVKNAVLQSGGLVGGIFYDYGLDELIDLMEDDDALGRTCQAAQRMIRLFEALVVPELEWRKANPTRLQAATELLDQHRMHPVISTVISECFYGGRLKDADKVANRFLKGTPPVAVAAHLPKSPIVIVNMPYVQEEDGANEEMPAYHNPAEIDAILKTIAGLTPLQNEKGEWPSLAVLSPYNEQVTRLDLALANARGELPQLARFEKPKKRGGYEGTVDSFQGGEADVVIVSLVRNNGHSGMGALGFVRRRRRMNVLLSRAKWKLIIVTSLKFLHVHARSYSGDKRLADEDREFLPLLVSVLDRLKGEKLEDGTPKVSIVEWAELREASR